MSAQLNCMLKHQHSDSDRQLQSHQSPLQFSASVIMQVCVCVCVHVQSKILILLMCCGLQCQYNCSARCHLIWSSCLPDTSGSLKSLYSSELCHDLIISAIVLLSSAANSTSTSWKKTLPVKRYERDLIKGQAGRCAYLPFCGDALRLNHVCALNMAVEPQLFQNTHASIRAHPWSQDILFVSVRFDLWFYPE